MTVDWAGSDKTGFPRLGEALPFQLNSPMEVIQKQKQLDE
jgi:hypothetical protein